MDAVQNRIWNCLAELSGEEVLQAFTNYHGLQLLDDGFAETLEDDGYLEPEEDEEEIEDRGLAVSIEELLNMGDIDD